MCHFLYLCKLLSNVRTIINDSKLKRGGKKKKLLFEIDVNFFNVSQEKWEKNEGGQKEI